MANQVQAVANTLSLDTFLTNLSPDFKVGGVLIALSFLFFKIGNYFWNYETSASKDSIEKLKDILGHFKEIFIRPILEKKTYEWLEGAYQEAVKAAYDHMTAYSAQIGTPLGTKEIDQAFSAYNQATLVADLKSNDRVIEFYSSPSGVSLLDKLDASYLKARDYKRFYDQKISSCRNLMYYSYALALILFCSIVHIAVPFSAPIVFFTIYSSLLIFLLGLISFVRFEIYRRRLVSTWEELQTIGNLNA